MFSLLKALVPGWAFGLNWYTIDTINTAIVPKIDKLHAAQLFIGMGYVVEKLWNTAKTDRINMFEVPIHFTHDSNVQGLDAIDQIKGSHGEILTKGYDSMRSIGDLAILSTDEYGDQGPGDKFIDLLAARRGGKMDGIRDAIRKSFWRRTAADATSTTASSRINGFYDLYNETSMHNISGSTYPIWAAKVWAFGTDITGGTASTRAGLKDSDTNAFLLSLIDRMIAYMKSRGCKPMDSCITLPSALYALACDILQEQDHRVPDGTYAAKSGYTSFTRKSFDVVEDDGMAENQTTGSDATHGLIGAVHFPSCGLRFANPAKIVSDPFTKDSDKTYYASAMTAKCQFVCHDRSKFCFVKTIWNEKGYIPAVTTT